MNIQTFSRILRAFADTPTDIDLSRGRLYVQVRDEVIEAELSERGGELFVTENGDRTSAGKWVVSRIARLPILAEKIANSVEVPSTFVAPAGKVLDQFERSQSVDERACGNVIDELRSSLDQRLAGFTSATYLTSDAGEGKTTTINSLARAQAKAFKEKTTDWLLVPIPLGGKAFLHFDDVVVAALVNRYRFPFYYYEAFIELVRLGVLVPAFDGFEEMFIETASGEAVSALGSMLNALESEGSIVIAARKAYFEYQSFRTQAKLFDSIGKIEVAFSRISLDRWRQKQFLELANSWGIHDANALYEALAQRLGKDHPLLTRAVLASRLIEEAIQAESVDHLIQRLGNSPQDYFYSFVTAIVEREAKEKWTDKSGEPFKPLLSVEEHHELLSMVSAEMWNSGVESLRADVLDVVSEIFCDRRGAAVTRQVKERLKQHALITVSQAHRGQYAFDHEDFRKFYLGESLGSAMVRLRSIDVHSILKAGSLSAITVEQACLLVARNQGDIVAVLKLVQNLASGDLLLSYVRENAGAIAMYLISAHDLQHVTVAKMTLVSSALASRQLKNISFEDCYFQPTSTSGSRLQNCTFFRCEFERLELGPEIQSATMVDCQVPNVVLLEEDRQLFSPAEISYALQDIGFSISEQNQQSLQFQSIVSNVHNDDIELLQRALRIFLRSTQINEGTIRVRLGTRSNDFFDNLLPRLLAHGVMEEVLYRGNGVQRRFKVSVRMENIQYALNHCGNNLEKFFEEVKFD
ncbi:hypothetical protein [Nevskia ramosa]|uniref:hypothetical protein n=1 Tax=Nevskia ramosa TaxID=64002 RepID=UPI0004164B33|nr:hypothetical protein [Nevskia ramosa]